MHCEDIFFLSQLICLFVCLFCVFCFLLLLLFTFVCVFVYFLSNFDHNAYTVKEMERLVGRLNLNKSVKQYSIHISFVR